MAEIDVQETLRLLRGLQDLDRDLYGVRDEIRRLPKERQRRREAIDRRKHDLEELDRQVHGLQVRVKEIEDMTTQQRQRLRKLENEAANSKDTALIMAFQHEMRTLKRDISEAEEEGLGLVERVDALDVERTAIREEIEAAETSFAEYDTNIERELSAAESKRSELDQERRERMAGKVDPAVLDRYGKLLDAREGQALAELDGRICQGCYVAVPSNLYVRLARGIELVQCPSCNRLLYLRDF